MVGLGTIINAGAIIVGGLLGIFFKKLITERLKNSLIIAIGVAVIVLGLDGAIEKMTMLKSDNMFLSGGSLVMILCLVFGTLIGELINVDKGLERFGEWLKVKSKSQEDNGFLNGFLTASFTVSIGAMAVIGAINDGMQINGTYTVLLVKSVLDFVFVMVMSSTLGKGCIFSAIPVAVIQGVITVIAYFCGELLNANAINYLSLVGNVLILCVGINLLFDRKIKVANMTPSIILAIICGYIF